MNTVNLDQVRDYFTDAEWETIVAALEDYVCYSDDDTDSDDLIGGIPVVNRVDSINSKINKLYR